MLIPPHNINLSGIYTVSFPVRTRGERGYFECPFSSILENIGLLQCRLNRDSSVNSSWLQSRCIQSRWSMAHFFSDRTVCWGERNWPACIEATLLKPILVWSAWYPTSYCQKKLSLQLCEFCFVKLLTSITLLWHLAQFISRLIYTILLFYNSFN